MTEHSLSLLQVFDNAMQDFSHVGTSILAIIPGINIVNKWLSMDSVNSKFNSSICTTIGIAKQTINKYYSKTDELKIYHIIMNKFSSYIF